MYILVDERIAERVVDIKCWDWPKRAHCPVEVTLSARQPQHRIKKLSEPKAFPKSRPFGPSRPLEETELWEAAGAQQDDRDPETLHDAVSQRCALLTQKLKEELCDVCDLFVDNERDRA